MLFTVIPSWQKTRPINRAVEQYNVLRGGPNNRAKILSITGDMRLAAPDFKAASTPNSKQIQPTQPLKPLATM